MYKFIIGILIISLARLSTAGENIDVSITSPQIINTDIGKVTVEVRLEGSKTLVIARYDDILNNAEEPKIVTTVINSKCNTMWFNWKSDELVCEAPLRQYQVHL